MAANILVINSGKIKLEDIIKDLNSTYNSVKVVTSNEDALKVIRTQIISLILITVPRENLDAFYDFFSVIRSSCFFINIAAITKYTYPAKHKIYTIGIDEFFRDNISKRDLAMKVASLTKYHLFFNSHVMNNSYANNNLPEIKVVIFFFENTNFLNKEFLNNAKIQSNKQPRNIPINTDIVIINAKHEAAVRLCQTISVNNNDKNLGIILAYDQESKNKALLAMIENAGCTDIMDINAPSSENTCKIKSSIKQKQIYDNFIQQTKKNIYMSSIDTMTGVYNRSFFDDYIGNNNYIFTDTAIIMIDVDKFKSINDRFGHVFADSMLKHISETLKKQIRANDMIARYGGDEFIIVMRNVDDDTAIKIATRIKNSIEQSAFYETNCTISVGVCLSSNYASISIKEAINIADKQMYVAKKTGGNKISII